MKSQCKCCINYIDGVCCIFHRARASGKKRVCGFFKLKFIEKKPISVLQYIRKDKSRKAKKLAEERLAQLQKIEREIEQKKLVSAAIAEPKIILPKGNVAVKKPNVVKKFLRRVCSS